MEQEHPKFSNRLAQAAKMLAEGMLYLWISAVILYGTPLSEIFNIPLGYTPDPLIVLEGVEPLLWWLGLAGTLCLLIGYVRRWTSGAPRPMAFTIATAVAFSMLYLLDPLLNTMPFYFFAQRDWTLLMWLIFLLPIWVYNNNRREVHLADFVLFCIGLQAVFAIGNHLLGINQFHTPNFGNRTQGTYDNPNVFYPLALIGAGMAFARSLTEHRRDLRLLHGLVAILCTASIWMTYTRGAWLALILMCLWALIRFRRWLPQRTRYGLVMVAVLFGVGMLFWRTGGRLLANPDDRPAWGRVAIWKVAWNIYTQRPVLGHGVMSYRLLQNRHMTPELQAFDPRNVEAKNLLLNLGVEFGAIGVLLFLLYAGSLWNLSGWLASRQDDTDSAGLGMGGQLILLGILVAGLFDTPVLESFRIPSTMAQMLVFGLATARALHTCPAVFSPRVRNATGFRMRYVTVALLVLLAASISVIVWGAVRKVRDALPRVQALSRARSDGGQEIPQALRHLVIASEDGYYLVHHGVDWQALHRALRVNLRNLRFKQGGSTITMQTARYLLLGREKTLSRKIAEILLALEMERTLSKARILELYLNSVRFGLGAQDIGTACAVYFGKKPSELSFGEAAFLVGVLPEPPRGREELTPEKVERCKNRALSRLAYFFSSGYYSPAQIERAYRERITFVWQKGGQSGR